MALDTPPDLSPAHAHHLNTCVPWQGKTCRVRPFVPSDAPALFDFVKRPSVSKHMNWEPHESIVVSERYLDSVCAAYGHDAHAPWAIATLEDDRAVGFVGFTHFCADHRRSDMAVALHPEFAGRGMAYEACAFLFAQARRLGLMRVQAVVETGNEASQRLMQRLGMQERVLLQNYLVSKGGATDAFLYAIFFADNRPPMPAV